MSDEQSELSKKRGERLPAKVSLEPVIGAYEFVPTGNTSRTDAASQSPAESIKGKSFWPFDPMRIVAALKEHRRRLLWSACAATVLGLMAGWFTSTCKIKITLVMRDLTTTFAAGAGDSYRPSQLAVQTFVDLMTSPELARRVAAKAQPPVSENTLKNSVTATLGREKDIVTLTITGKGRRALTTLAELYANEAAQLGKELQVIEISRMNQFYKDRIVAADGELTQVNDEMAAFRKESGTIDPEAEAQAYAKQLSELLSRDDSSRIELEMSAMRISVLQTELARQSPIAQKLEAAKAKLSDLLSRYTEEHPSVQGQRAQIASLGNQLAASDMNNFSAASFGENSLGGTLYLRLIELQTRAATLEKELLALDGLKQTLRDKVTGISKKGLHYAVIKAKLDSQKNSLSLLANRQREAQLYEANALGYFRLFAQPRLNDVDMSGRWLKTFGFALAGFVLGVLGAGLVVAAREITDDRLKTASDVKRVTGLPVLASLGDLDGMSPAQREQWAFRTWTALSGQLNASPSRGMVCGFISSMPGEGCSTWIKLLADAAAQRGLRVLTVATQSSSASPESQTPDSAIQSEAGAGAETTAQEIILTSQVLASPADVERQFAGANVPAVAHVPLTGWVWNLERRRQWQGALAQWQAVDDLVLLVELPPASSPEAVLLAENLPQLLWLADSGRARTRETRQQLETLRHAKCRLVGAVLNHEPRAAFNL